jgi:hypothetical protein
LEYNFLILFSGLQNVKKEMHLAQEHGKGKLKMIPNILMYHTLKVILKIIGIQRSSECEERQTCASRTGER